MKATWIQWWWRMRGAPAPPIAPPPLQRARRPWSDQWSRKFGPERR